jgi:hypothetical protein
VRHRLRAVAAAPTSMSAAGGASLTVNSGASSRTRRFGTYVPARSGADGATAAE